MLWSRLMFEDTDTDIMDDEAKIFLIREWETNKSLVAIVDIKFLIALKS